MGKLINSKDDLISYMQARIEQLGKERENKLEENKNLKNQINKLKKELCQKKLKTIQKTIQK